MKPVILHTEVSDGWGGQEIRIFNEIIGVKNRGYDVILATPSQTTISWRAKEAGIETYDVPMGKADFVRGVYEIVKIVKKRRVSIINTHSSRDSWIGSIAGRLTGAKVVRTRHISSDLKKDVLTKLVYGPLTDAIITTGEFIRGQLINGLGIAGEKVTSIPTGIDIEKFSSGDVEKVRTELGFGPDDIVLGTAAALRSWKGHEFLIKAMPLLSKDYPQIKMVFAGEGRRKARIKNWADELGISKSLFLLGHREDVADVIKSFDISLLVSYASEGIPQFVLQSMAAGKPVIGTTVGGIPEVVRDGVNGVLVPPMDPAAIADAVRHLLAEPGRMEQMGRAGYDMAVRGHSLNAMLDSLEALYRRLAA